MTTDQLIDNQGERVRNPLFGEYRALLTRFCVLLRAYSLETRPFKSTDSIFFFRLSPERQRAVVSHFRTYIEACEHVHASGVSALVNKTLLWRMFVSLKVRPEAGLLELISDDDFIEIYNADYVQVFRNPVFFSVCSYSIDELLCRPWWELFYRAQEVTESIFNVAAGVFSGRLKGIVSYDLPAHTVDELDSPRLYQSVVENRFVSPLYDSNNKVAAAVNVIRGISCVSRAGASADRGGEHVSRA